MTSLVLIARGRGGGSAHLNVTTSTTFAELLALTNTQLGLKLQETDIQRIRLLSGFPPRPLALDLCDAIGGHVQNKESLKVEVKEHEGGAPASTAPKSKSAPPKVKTASKALAKKPRAQKTGVYGLGGPSSSASKKRAPVASSSSSASSSSFGAMGSPPKPKRRRAIGLGSSEAELGASLVGAQGTSGGGTEGLFWRRVMKNAVGNQVSSYCFSRRREEEGGLVALSAKPLRPFTCLRLWS